MLHSFKTVLLVEDDPGQAIAVELLLQDYGFASVLTAADADTALTILRQQRIDLLVCDLSLPGKDGVSLLKDASQLPLPPDVVVLSAVEDSLLGAVSRIAVDLGLTLLGAVAKPLTTEILDTLLQSRVAGIGDDPLNAMNAVAKPTALTDAELRLALQEQRFEPFYEVKINCESGRVEGVELLARLRSADGNLIEPNDFIAGLEAIGKIDEMTWQVAERGFSFLRHCQDSGLPLNVSLNLSPSMLVSDNVIDRLDALVQRHRLDYQQVTLEITESLAIDSSPEVLQRLVHLRLRGFGLSIDDFGTGFSSLMQLSKVPFTEMKIDRAFVNAALSDPKSKAVVESCIELAWRLSLKVCAEGIDSHEVFWMMSDLRVNALQGYLFSRPLPENELEAWAVNWHRRITVDGIYPGTASRD